VEYGLLCVEWCIKECTGSQALNGT